jgi:exopolysaccharide biosynthesis protein
VLAAVNGDYFNLTSGVPSSAIYKKGIPIKSQYCALCTFLSIDDQNKPYIVSKDRPVDTTKIREAIGGFHFLVKNSLKVTQGDLSIEPRTTVGVTTANVVYFILVDGRQASYSNGISFSQLSDMYFALGVKDAINMDGGGSTTLVIKEGTTWAVKNKPSDGSQRAIANAWTIVDIK